MIAVLDANFLGILLAANAAIPPDPQTKQPYQRPQERVEHLIEKLQESNTRILIPTPALGEFLILVHPYGARYVAEIKNAYRLEIAQFDELAAIELAELSSQITKPKKIQRGEQTWAKLKYDRQIVAIALSRGAQAIYSTDGDVRKLAERHGIQPFDLKDLPLPPPKQEPLQFEEEKVTRIEQKRQTKEQAAIAPPSRLR